MNHDIFVLFAHGIPVAASDKPFQLPEYGDKTTLQQVSYGHTEGKTVIDQRAAFEDWWVSRPHRAKPEKYDDGDYRSPAAQNAWAAWQASAEMRQLADRAIRDALINDFKHKNETANLRQSIEDIRTIVNFGGWVNLSELDALTLVRQITLKHGRKDADKNQLLDAIQRANQKKYK